VVRERVGEAPDHVVVIATLGAPERRRLASRRSRPAEPEPDPAPVATTRATAVETEALDDAEAWLRRIDLARTAAEALGVLNRLVHSHRIATANPYVHELSMSDAIAVRVGYGDGERVADGRWSVARELPATAARRVKRSAALQPQERLAALLGARDRALATEEFALRARLDLDHGRPLAAALGVRLALESALVELPASGAEAGLAERLRELHELRDPIIAAANAGLVGPLTAEQAETVEHTLRRVEAALRARTVLQLKLS
jgi:hypothetical protein